MSTHDSHTRGPLPVIARSTTMSISAITASSFHAASQAELPDLDRAFAPARAQASGSNAKQLTVLQTRLQSEIERAATRSFRRSLLYSAGFAGLVWSAACGLAAQGQARTWLVIFPPVSIHTSAA